MRMVKMRNSPVSKVDEEVSKWFGKTTLGPVFLGGDKRVYRVSADERENLYASAQAEVLNLHQRMTRRTTAAILLFVIVLTFNPLRTIDLVQPWADISNGLSWAIYASHGLWVAFESFVYDQRVKSVRDRITESMASHIPLPSGMVDEMTSKNPAYTLLVTSGVVLLGLWLAAEVAAKQGVDLIEKVPVGMFYALIPFLGALRLASFYIDRDRGVGL
jgi:hypothetical protein